MEVAMNTEKTLETYFDLRDRSPAKAEIFRESIEDKKFHAILNLHDKILPAFLEAGRQIAHRQD